MGLAVSQVRLLALTNRKADIELRMQIDSKRKMMLTRKSTELAQRYYSKLQNSNIQYATGSGYEDVNFNYLMGDTDMNNQYSASFLQSLAVNSSKLVKKAANNMILTNQFGEVITNDSLATIVAKTEDNYTNASTAKKTCYAILQLVEDYKNKVVSDTDTTGLSALKLIYSQYGSDLGIDQDKKDVLAQNMTYMLSNGGYKGNRILYVRTTDDDPSEGSTWDSGPYYLSASDAKSGKGEKVYKSDLEIGCCYEIRNSNSSLIHESTYYGSSSASSTSRDFVPGFTLQTAKYLSNLVSYFGPMISAAIQNGTSTTVNRINRDNAAEISEVGTAFHVKVASELKNSSGIVNFDMTQSISSLENQLKSVINYANSNSGAAAGLTNADSYVKLANENGDVGYYVIAYNGTTGKYSLKNIDATSYYESYDIENNSAFSTAMNTDKLQAGFRSGTCQFAMVTDNKHGIYHKNTTMNYFTHMNYVVERTDSSKREEITAWFNAEQAEISEQETYWDTEIQNLSAELSSVNTEISSVKQLKSDNIKSVFNWGGS